MLTAAKRLIMIPFVILALCVVIFTTIAFIIGVFTVIHLASKVDDWVKVIAAKIKELLK